MTTIFGGVGGALAWSSASGGKVRAFNNISNVTPRVVAPANPSRQVITFHNPGTVDIFVYPDKDVANVTQVVTTAALGGSFRIYANGGALTISGECQGVWNAIAASGTTNAFTTMESNI